MLVAYFSVSGVTAKAAWKLSEAVGANYETGTYGWTINRDTGKRKTVLPSWRNFKAAERGFLCTV